MSATFEPVASYMPHRPPMLLIDGIDEVTAAGIVCRATIQPDCVFATNGAVHPSAMIEFVAQACSIFVGVTAARDGDPPRLGFLVGCREISFDVDSFFVGDELTIAATKVHGQHQIAGFTATVARGGAPCVSIQLSVVDAAMAGVQLTTAGRDP